MVKVWDEYRADKESLAYWNMVPEIKETEENLSRLDNELRSLNFVKVDRNLPGHRGKVKYKQRWWLNCRKMRKGADYKNGLLPAYRKPLGAEYKDQNREFGVMQILRGTGEQLTMRIFRQSEGWSLIEDSKTRGREFSLPLVFIRGCTFLQSRIGDGAYKRSIQSS